MASAGASPSILSTKLFIPPLGARVIARARILERIQRERDNPLTLIVAPAGYGKSTVASQWANSRMEAGERVSWLSLDVEENDVTRFLTYLIAAVQSALPGVGQTANAMLQSPQPGAPEVILVQLINDLASDGNQLTLILDDYHLIDSGEVHNAVRFLIDNAPSTFCLFVVGREVPPLRQASLRARGRILELGREHLRFTPAETSDFLSSSTGGAVDDLLANELEQSTEGWIAGLQLAAISIRDGRDLPAEKSAFAGTQRYVFDYLAGDVFSAQPAPIKAFLLQTSILNRFSASLCEAVTAQPAGRSTIGQLAASNLFLVPLDTEGVWYRYHHLFSDFLRDRLSRTEGMPTLAELHYRAAKWHGEQGLAAEAVQHFVAAGKFEEAAELAEQVFEDMFSMADFNWPIEWFEAFPDAVMAQRPLLSIFHAWGLAFSFRFDESISRLHQAEAAVSKIEARRGTTERIRGMIEACRAAVAAFSRDLDGAIEHAKVALELLPEAERTMRRSSAVALGTGHWGKGETQIASEAFEIARSSLVGGENDLVTVMAISNLAEVRREEGRLHDAAEVAESAIEMATRGLDHPLPMASMGYLAMANIEREWNDLDSAIDHATQAKLLSDAWGNLEVNIAASVACAHVYAAKQQLENAIGLFEEARQLAEDNGVQFWISRIEAALALVALGNGDLTSAVRWSERSGISSGDPAIYDREQEQIAFVRVLNYEGRYSEARSLGERILEAAEHGGRNSSVIAVSLALADANLASRDSDAAMLHMREALVLACPQDYTRVFLDEGERIVELLELAGARDIETACTERILAHFKRELNVAEPTSQSLPDPLSERELEVLGKIISGSSNQAIADEFVIAISTVKTHINNIYGKLGVRSRTQAIARARELDIP